MQTTGFGLPRAVKSTRVMQLIKDHGIHLSQVRYLELYKEKYGDKVSLATVQNALSKVKTDAVILLGIARTLRDVPQEKLTVLVELSAKYGYETVMNAIRTCLMGEETLVS